MNSNLSKPEVSAGDVFKSFWTIVRQHKAGFFAGLLLLAGTSVVTVFVPLYYREFFDALASAEPATKGDVAQQLLGIILIVLGLNALQWLLFRSGTIVFNTFESRVMAKLRQQAFDWIMNHSYSFFSNNFTGSLVQRVNRYARSFENFADRLAWNVVPLAVNIAGTTIVLYTVKPAISVAILIFVAAFFSFNLLFSRWKLKYDIAVAEMDSKSTGLLSDDITNHTTIQLFTGLHGETASFREVTTKQSRTALFSWNMSAVVDAVQALLIIVTEFILFFISIRYWQLGIISIGTFVLIQTYFLRLGNNLWDFTRIVRQVYQAFADAKEMVEIFKTPHDIKDVPGAQGLNVAMGAIEFKDVAFAFNQTREVLSGINLHIQAGEKVALIGPSGAGKSTLVRLILRFYEVAAGSILIDGTDIKSVTQDSLRKSLSFVPQDPLLFHRTLKENIRYGRPDATDAEILEAATLAHCDEFIKDLPLGYDTYVGERGIKLSGGERQRIAIARAILKNAPILILDEATSSLDSESEHLIQDALDTLMKGKTVIVIAHRLSTIRKMDRIVVLDQGKITEEGTHEGLLRQDSSLYKKLWNLQAGGFLHDA